MFGVHQLVCFKWSRDYFYFVEQTLINSPCNQQKRNILYNLLLCLNSQILTGVIRTYLLADGGNQEALDLRQGRHRPLLLFGVNFLKLVFGQGLSRFRYHLDYVVDKYLAISSNIFQTAIKL